MLLNSPAGIGLSTSEDIHLSADGQINQIAGDSIDLSTQKNLVAHVQNRISLFAAQRGIKQVAAKGKYEAHAQSDGMDLLAKQGIQIISTEDRIEVISAKEIVITGKDSQLKLNGSGIFPTTGGKFEVKAGQHKFESGGKINFDVPYLPSKDTYSHQFILKNNKGALMPDTNYVLTDINGKKIRGITDKNGKTKRIYTSEKEKFILDIDI